MPARLRLPRALRIRPPHKPEAELLHTTLPAPLQPTDTFQLDCGAHTPLDLQDCHQVFPPVAMSVGGAPWLYVRRTQLLRKQCFLLYTVSHYGVGEGSAAVTTSLLKSSRPRPGPIPGRKQSLHSVQASETGHAGNIGHALQRCIFGAAKALCEKHPEVWCSRCTSRY